MMLSSWIHVDNHIILHQSHFYFIAFFAFSAFLFLINCAQRGGTPADKKTATTTTQSATPGESATVAQDSLMVKPESPNETKSKKEGRMMDSIKIIRGKANFRKALKRQKKDDVDSQHTQLINVPLGKASESSSGVSKLTATEEQKVVEKPNGKKIQFADKLVKSTITPEAKK